MKHLLALLLLMSLTSVFAAPDTAPAWREDFSNTVVGAKKRLLPKGWELGGMGIFVSSGVMEVVPDSPATRKVLRLTCDDAARTLKCEVKGVDLAKYPVARWCWRVKQHPKNGDARYEAKDAQAIGIYFGTGTIRQQAVAYRWENETPKNDSGRTIYFGGLAKVQWVALRNRTDALGEWTVETRNVLEDFKSIYGFVPEAFGFMIAGSSDKTNGRSVAEIAWIEMLPLSALEAEKTITAPSVSDTERKN